MSTADYNKAEAKALEIVKSNFVVEPPVRIEDIVSNYGLSVVSVSLEETMPGVAGIIDPETMRIYVNAADSPARKAFTIAHELGHWLLHRDKLIAAPNEYAVLYRRPLGEPIDDPVEKEANCFAAHLLVPKTLLEKYKNEDVNIIAKIFGVSPEVIGYRMKREYGI